MDLKRPCKISLRTWLRPMPSKGLIKLRAKTGPHLLVRKEARTPRFQSQDTVLLERAVPTCLDVDFVSFKLTCAWLQRTQHHVSTETYGVSKICFSHICLHLFQGPEAARRGSPGRWHLLDGEISGFFMVLWLFWLLFGRKARDRQEFGACSGSEACLAEITRVTAGAFNPM